MNNRTFLILVVVYGYTLGLCFLWYSLGTQRGYDKGYQTCLGEQDDDK